MADLPVGVSGGGPSVPDAPGSVVPVQAPSGADKGQKDTGVGSVGGHTSQTHGALGPGGLGNGNASGSSDGDDKDKKKKGGAARAIGAANTAAGAAEAGAVGLGVMNVANAAATAAHGLMAFAQGLVAGVANLVTGVAAVLGAPVAAVYTAAALVLGGGSVFTVAAVVNATATSVAQRDYVSDDCRIDVERSFEGFEMQLDQRQVDIAYQFYSVFAYAGIPDTNISGILGNWSAESTIDPTAVEGIYNEPFAIGVRKAEALGNLESYTRNTLFSKYALAGKSISQSGYRASDGHYYCGLGIGQFTGEGAYRLVALAERLGRNWYDADVQAVYCLMPGGFKSDWLTSWIEEEDSPGDAARTFMVMWEGVPSGNLDNRTRMAEYWAAQIATWTIDVDYASSVIEAAGDIELRATSDEVSNQIEHCMSDYEFDNTSLAKAAVSFAWETHDLGRGNNGTPLYQTVKRYIFPGDEYFMDCARCVATAVRWSGYDDDYPVGNTEVQLNYLLSHKSQWREVPWEERVVREWEEQRRDEAGELLYNPDGSPIMDTMQETEQFHSMESLLPGDILIKFERDADGELGTHHTMIYVGNDMIRAKWPEHNDPRYCMVSASQDERSPGCGYWITEYETYHVFRNLRKSQSPKYKNASAYIYD